MEVSISVSIGTRISYTCSNPYNKRVKKKGRPLSLSSCLTRETFHALVMPTESWDGSPPPGEPTVPFIPAATRMMWWQGVSDAYKRDGAFVIELSSGFTQKEAEAEATRILQEGAIAWLVTLGEYDRRCKPLKLRI